MKKLSQQLLEMSQQTAAWENRAAARHEENRQELEADTAEAQARVQTAQADFNARLNSMHQSTATQWSALQQSFHNQVAAARRRVGEQKAALDLNTARAQADAAEAYAEIAAEFARLAATEADAAQREAVASRAYAKSLEKATPTPQQTTA